MTTVRAPAPCFLCHSKEAHVIQSLTPSEILKLWSLCGVSFEPISIQSLLERDTIHLYACTRCGFHFFDPQLAGGERFYAQIHAQFDGYYSPNRPENERNACYASKHGYSNILDVGCGTGFALDVAKSYGLDTYGLELTSTAADEARHRGHTILSIPLQELDSSWEGKFDMISLNQLLEHVPDPVDFVKQSSRLLSARGVMAIAVPSTEGILRFHPWVPTNWPPHHLSRWRGRDLYQLAAKCNLKVTRSGGDRLLGTTVTDAFLSHRKNCIAVNKFYRFLPPALIKFAGFAYRKAGLKYVFTKQGHSVYCFLQRA